MVPHSPAPTARGPGCRPLALTEALVHSPTQTSAWPRPYTWVPVGKPRLSVRPRVVTRSPR